MLLVACFIKFLRLMLVIPYFLRTYTSSYLLPFFFGPSLALDYFLLPWSPFLSLALSIRLCGSSYHSPSYLASGITYFLSDRPCLTMNYFMLIFTFLPPLRIKSVLNQIICNKAVTLPIIIKSNNKIV
jgi:hypothetical protein